MTATDELRRLLDERGIEYYPKAADETVFSTGTEHVHVQDDLIDGCLELFIRPVTPQQAVEATLGRGGCTVVSKLLIEGEYVPSSYYEFEMECGEGFKWDESIPPRYCPNCGAKVVDA